MLGDHVSATSTSFVTHDGGVWVFRDEWPDADVFGRITVGSNVFLGAGVLVLPGRDDRQRRGHRRPARSSPATCRRAASRSGPRLADSQPRRVSDEPRAPPGPDQLGVGPGREARVSAAPPRPRLAAALSAHTQSGSAGVPGEGRAVRSAAEPVVPGPPVDIDGRPRDGVARPPEAVLRPSPEGARGPVLNRQLREALFPRPAGPPLQEDSMFQRGDELVIAL